ncbi:DUF3048 domain-containing protein [Streptomyces sp. ST2-7A]|uniref:DUF3048 domain-containing protein n=1 Tax=Streptomyces sp. ST2-7A TaxID=2907214 RepID=UPI001F48CC8C|nr:DUF3048 domain-containing protein [Streptomyces sp. ST2-7A]MCE7083324.1 DUF3048 domain-containing protein [Streptomyces sp. ST2-7A]
MIGPSHGGHRTSRPARSRRPRRRLVALALCLPLALLPACGLDTTGGDPGVSPFTGVEGPDGPVLAVKVDNVAPARPHTGLEDAAIVYVEEVEAGLTRLVAVYSGTVPARVGPVRSVRESDLELLAQFGRPALGFSGARSDLLPEVRSSPMLAVAPEDAPGAFERDTSRLAPHNLYLDPEAVIEAAGNPSTSRDIGFRFGDPPPGGEPTGEYTVAFPGTSVGFRWSEGDGRWEVFFDGEPAGSTAGGTLGAATVVVQYVTVRPSEYADRGGYVTPYTETVGEGPVVVLRDGRAYTGDWSRLSAGGGTRFTDGGGNRLTFAPGQVWVVLAPVGDEG